MRGEHVSGGRGKGGHFQKVPTGPVGSKLSYLAWMGVSESGWAMDRFGGRAYAPRSCE